jgi:hypothetical protein
LSLENYLLQQVLKLQQQEALRQDFVGLYLTITLIITGKLSPPTSLEATATRDIPFDLQVKDLEIACSFFQF